MQEIASVKDANVIGKRIVVRVDFNVPLQDGKVADDLRIRTALPTLTLLLGKGAAHITLLTHVGRPNGAHSEALSVGPVAARLKELLDAPNVELHENLRFDPREEANDEGFAKELAQLGDIYVNEAFSNSHRAHASMVGIPSFIPGYAGLNVLNEIEHLEGALTPPKGSVALVGGSKFETKLPLIKKLLPLYEHILLGGALANDVIKARGLPFGGSLISDIPVPPEVAMDDRLVVPTDAIFAQEGTNTERSGLIVDVRTNERVIDIGPQTSSAWAQVISQAPFVLWNGPMGIYEEGYRDGTEVLAQALAASQARAVVGGGDTAAALAKAPFNPERVFLSTGGGAMLEYLAEGTLPALEALKR